MFLLSACRLNGRQWAEKQARDIFVAKSREKGYVARSAFKLIEIDDKFGIFSPRRVDQNATVVRSACRPTAVLDLGCSPGSWCQVIRERCGDPCQIFALDLLPARVSVRNAIFVQGDFTDLCVQAELRSKLSLCSSASPVSDGVLDVVTSDMCPNRMGGASDRQRQIALQQQALVFALPLLRPGGHFVCKTLGSRTSQGELWTLMNRWFRRVSSVKPQSSRRHSDEEFLVGRDRLDVPRPPSPLGVGSRPQRGNSFGLEDWPGFSRLPRRGRREER